uniref:Heat shock factor-binding protein 1 n=1 Tax=Rhinolophus ferrumequinum TaxID=59479 RepID=A0A671DUG7_RHIFE
MAETDPKTLQDLSSVVQTLLQQMQDMFQTMSDQIMGTDDMSSHIHELQKYTADLTTQASEKSEKVKTRYLPHIRVEGC